MEKTAIIRGIYIADEKGSFVSRRLEEVELEFGGIRGDRHFGLTMKSDVRQQKYYPRGTEIANRRQISVLAEEEMEATAENMEISELLPEWVGGNLLLSGVPDLSLLPPNTRLLFPSGAGLVCEAENIPCKHAGREVENHVGAAGREDLPALYVKAAKHKRGIVCSVERPGLIRTGDEVRVAYP